MIFLKKSFLDPKYVLAVEIFDGFHWIEVMVRFRFRVYGHDFGVGLGRTNSKKSKK